MEREVRVQEAGPTISFIGDEEGEALGRLAEEEKAVVQLALRAVLRRLNLLVVVVLARVVEGNTVRSTID